MTDEEFDKSAFCSARPKFLNPIEKKENSTNEYLARGI